MTDFLRTEKLLADWWIGETVVHMINNTSAKCKHCMTLLRLVVLEGMVYNVRISAKHVGTKQNGKADALSRLDFKRFELLATDNEKDIKQWRIQDFPEGGREPSRGGVNTPNFPENCMKSKEFGRPGGACVPHAPPLDPPMSRNEQFHSDGSLAK